MPFLRNLALITLLQASSCLAEERPCKFILGYAEPKPDWFTVNGNASLEVARGKLKALLYDSRMDGELSHSLTGTVKTGKVNGVMKNHFSDEGDNHVSGSYELSKYRDGEGPKVVQSLVVQNAFTFVAVTCYAKSGP